MAKLVLHTFGGSVWAAAAELAAAELYDEGQIDFKTVNLIEGENFAPQFVQLNPNATLPTLETPDEGTKTSTKDVIAYLVAHSSKQVKKGTESIIDTVHEEKYDPNFALLLARDDEELKAKAASVPGLFIGGRQAMLDKTISTPEAAPLKAFYEAKTAFNSGLHAIYQEKAPADVKQGFYDKSKAHVVNVASCLYEYLPTVLPASGFIGGEVPGEDDFHVEAWLTRIAATSGATNGDDALKAFETALGQGKAVPPVVETYWKSWVGRASWKKVYSAALH